MAAGVELDWEEEEDEDVAAGAADGGSAAGDVADAELCAAVAAVLARSRTLSCRGEREGRGERERVRERVHCLLDRWMECGVVWCDVSSE